MKIKKVAKEALDFSIALTVSVSVISILHFFDVCDLCRDFAHATKNKIKPTA